jgi:acetyl-CoA synthetase
VAEAGATGRPDELRKESPATVRQELGPAAVIGDMEFVTMLPKTRSGKLMRRVLKAVTLGKEPGDMTTIEDESSVEEARRAREQLRAEVGSVYVMRDA